MVQPGVFEFSHNSTPSDLGSASTSENFRSVLADDVKPSILADIADHATCSIEAFLNSFLVLCLPKETRDHPPPDLLKTCLEEVLLICNTRELPKEQMNGKQASKHDHAASIRENLMEYDSQDPRDPRQTLKHIDMVLKVYWPEELRVTEEEIIHEAYKIAEKEKTIKDHLPDLICSYGLPQYSTSRFRTLLGMKQSGSRVLRMMLFRRLYPITELAGPEFWKAFWECFRWPRSSLSIYLWIGGLEHGEISVKNLMCDKDKANQGVLNDYDLSHIDGKQRPSGTERTGTLPFMALDLLTEAAWNGGVPRLYRHDCESFIWVLLWVCFRYDEGKEIPQPPFENLKTGDYNRCFAEKSAILQKIATITPTSSFERYGPTTRQLLRWLDESRTARKYQIFDGPDTDDAEPQVADVVAEVRGVLTRSGLPLVL